MLTPELKDPKQSCISNLFYKGLSVLRYAIEMNVGVDIIENFIDPKYCRRELVSLRDPVTNKKS